MTKRLGFGLLAVVLVLAGCATSPDDPNRNAKEKAAMGAAAGAVLGAVVGYSSDKNRGRGAARGALIGAAAGGAVGAGVGAYMDKQQAEFERQLAAERNAHQIEVERLKNENLKITMNSEVSFDYDSAAIKPAFTHTLDKVNDIVAKYSRTNVVVVGHTDDRGSDRYNQILSEDRAKSVAIYMEDGGVSPRRISTEGRGEREPRATNATEAGRQLNRRVELLIIPDNDIQ